MSRIPINFLDIAKVYSIREIWNFYAKSATNGVNITNHYFGTLFDTKTTDRNFDERFSNYSILIPFRYLKVFVNTLSYRLHISKNLPFHNIFLTVKETIGIKKYTYSYSH